MLLLIEFLYVVVSVFSSEFHVVADIVVLMYVFPVELIVLRHSIVADIAQSNRHNSQIHALIQDHLKQKYAERAATIGDHD